MKYLTLICCYLTLSCSLSRNAVRAEGCEDYFDSLAMYTVYNKVDKMPLFKNDQFGIAEFLVKNFKYPKQEFFQGSFNIEFVVNTKGSVTAPRMKGKREEDLTEVEKELLRVVRTMLWVPGECLGVKVPVLMQIPFRL